MPWAYSNNGLSYVWHDPSENYQPKGGEVMFTSSATETQLKEAFPNYTAAVATQALQAEAAATRAAGCAITSISTPALNGTYACTPDWQAKITSTALYFQINGKFPGGNATMAWPDVAGTPHVFPSTDEFIAFSTAIGNFVAAIDEVLGGQSTTLPAQPIAIA